ncbi:hypothetical protein NLC29_01370 [Candidatus Aminicenantes bacterium AH-873-B07]|nr:hypothetical protein [Candidatus Aminicenantes bacterium AH-873-B07]
MILISLLTGIFLLLIFKYASNQEGIKKVKNKIKAHLLEIRLFKDNLGLMLKAQGNILRHNLTYMKYSFKPMLFIIIPLILIILQLDLWFSHLPLSPKKPAIIALTLKPDISPLEISIKLITPPEVKLETPPLRIAEENQINWRIRPLKEGKFLLKFKTLNLTLEKEIIVNSEKFVKLSHKKVSRNFLRELRFPGESPLPQNSIVESIEIKYPPARLNFLGAKIHWLIAFFVLSILFGFSLKRFLKVEI